MAAKSNRDTFRALHKQTAKAVRRGEKFARSLKRVVAQRNPDTPFEPLLQALENGLVTLSAEADELEWIGWPKKGAERTRGKSKPATATVTSSPKTKADRKVSAKGSGREPGIASRGVKRRETWLARRP